MTTSTATQPSNTQTVTNKLNALLQERYPSIDFELLVLPPCDGTIVSIKTNHAAAVFMSADIDCVLGTVLKKDSVVNPVYKTTITMVNGRRRRTTTGEIECYEVVFTLK